MAEINSSLSPGKVTALATTIALAAASLPARDAEASGLTSLSQLQNSYNLAADPMYQWAAAVKRVDFYENAPTVTSYASAVMIAPDLYINSGHFTPRTGSTVAFHEEIVFGSNYNTSTERYAVRATQRFPGYVFGDPSTIDLGIGWTTNFVPGFNAPTRFEAVSAGTQLTMVDYGNYGDSTTGELNSLGFKMAVRQPMQEFSSNGYPYPTYYTGRFFGPSASDPLNGLGLNSTSGAGLFTASGGLSAIHIAGNDNLNGGFGLNLNLLTPEIQTYLQPLIVDSWMRYRGTVPEPTGLAYLAVPAAVLLGRRRV